MEQLETKLEFYEILPAKYSEAITYFYDDYGFQTIFISLLIVSSVLGVNRKQLMKAFGGYIPAIFGGIILAAILGVGAAILVGVDVGSAITLYVLPIMGGGNGSGAGIVGTFFGFNFVESGITAGLCMANRGGSGDLQVLRRVQRHWPVPRHQRRERAHLQPQLQGAQRQCNGKALSCQPRNGSGHRHHRQLCHRRGRNGHGGCCACQRARARALPH